MNENDIKYLTSKVGDSHLYQYLTLALIFLLYGTTEFFVISLPMLERKPTVVFTNDIGEIVKTTINYTICEKYPHFQIDDTDPESSLVIDLNIFCDKTSTLLIGVTLFIGVLIGSLTSHYSTDRLGRKTTASIFSILYTITLCCFYFIGNDPIHVFIVIFLVGFFHSIVLLAAIILLTEVINKVLIAMFITVIYCAYRIFGLFYNYLFIEMNNWRLVVLMIAAINLFILIIFHLVIVESPRFYIGKKDKDGLIKSLNYIAKVNRKPAIDNDIALIEENLLKYGEPGISTNVLFTSFIGQSTNPEAISTTLIRRDRVIHQYTVLDLLKYESQRYNFLILNYLWFITSLIVCVLNINAKNITGDIYTNIFILYGSDLVVCILTSLLTNTKVFGRKRLVILLILIAIIAMELSLFTDQDNRSYYFKIGLIIAQVSLTALFNIELIISNEMYPTVLKAVGLGYNTAFAKVGSIIAPWAVEVINIDSDMVVFSALSVFGIMISFFLKDTYGKYMKNQVPEESEEGKGI
jgi:hypothetical protein